jgi:hypothetical protein
MSLLRICVSIPAIVVACAIGSAGLGGCYDLSSSGPRPEDFARAPASNGTAVDEQNEARPDSPTELDTSDALVESLGPQSRTESTASDPSGTIRR